MILDMHIPELLTRQQTAEILGLQPQTLAAWSCVNGPDRDLPFVKVGHAVRYRREDVLTFIERNRRKVTK